MADDADFSAKRPRREMADGSSASSACGAHPSPPSPTPGAGLAPPPPPIDFSALLPSERPEHPLLHRATAFGSETGALPIAEFAPGPAAAAALASARVLVIGAGGLGCEVLKGLALSGVRHIDVVDMDTIDVTNLNRQFLFRARDVGRPKAEAAAEFVRARVPGVRITAHTEAIQKKDPAWYAQFKVVIGSLDNLDARRWMNRTLVGLADEADPDTLIPYIDGGTEAFAGNVRVIVPRLTACFECILGEFPPQTTYAVCTITDKPRKPEHCVAYALQVLWLAAFPGRACDKDSPSDMAWVTEAAQARAAAHGIEGVTPSFALGVAKNIIPAIAATNAVVAAACVLEAVKLLTACSHTMNTTLTLNAGGGQHTFTLEKARLPGCSVCAPDAAYRVHCGPGDTLGELLVRLRTHPAVQVTPPYLQHGGTGHAALRVLCKALGAPPADEWGRARHEAEAARYRDNKELTMGELLGGEGGACAPPFFPLRPKHARVSHTHTRTPRHNNTRTPTHPHAAWEGGIAEVMMTSPAIGNVMSRLYLCLDPPE